MGKKRLIAAAVSAVAVMGLGAGSAFAGEVTGNGQSLKVENSKWGTGLHARSECAFSGQEDDQFLTGNGKGDPAHSQSFGQGVRNTNPAGGLGGFTPGLFCNPTQSSGEPG